MKVNCREIQKFRELVGSRKFLLVKVSPFKVNKQKKWNLSIICRWNLMTARKLFQLMPMKIETELKKLLSLTLPLSFL